MSLYTSRGKDEVIENRDLPQADVGSPNPVVFVNDRSCVLAYETIPDEEWVIVTFGGKTIYFGPPNDETLAAHPLARKGLKSYGMFEVRNSSWIDLLEAQNRVHPRHNPKRFESLKHFIWTFHDSIFEVVADGMSWQKWSGQRGDLSGVLGKHLK